MEDIGSSMVDVKEALVTQIPGTSHQNDHLFHPEFLPYRHG